MLDISGFLCDPYMLSIVWRLSKTLPVTLATKGFESGKMTGKDQEEPVM
jgi:hypothetical protein